MWGRLPTARTDPSKRALFRLNSVFQVVLKSLSCAVGRSFGFWKWRLHFSMALATPTAGDLESATPALCSEESLY